MSGPGGTLAPGGGARRRADDMSDGEDILDAGDRAFDEHAEWLFNVYRLVLADRGAASSLTAATLADACARRPQALTRVRLLELALERLPAGMRVPRAEAVAWSRHAAPQAAAAPELEAGAVDDATLALYVRSLPFPQRQVVALRTILGVDAARVAGLLGLHPRALAAVEADGLVLLRARLADHVAERAQRTQPVAIPAAATAHLQAEAVPVGTPQRGFVRRVLLVLGRLAERARATATLTPHDRSGGVSRPAPPPPTPTTRPIARPPATPSMHDYPPPGATSGTGVHRRSPSGTPSTQRLSNPRRPGRG
jgi:hypothetical protein